MNRTRNRPSGKT